MKTLLLHLGGSVLDALLHFKTQLAENIFNFVNAAIERFTHHRLHFFVKKFSERRIRLLKLPCPIGFENCHRLYLNFLYIEPQYTHYPKILNAPSYRTE